MRARVFATAPFTYPIPMVVVDTTRPSSFVARSAELRPSHVLPESVESVDDAFANDCSPVHVLVLARSVEDAAVTVIELPRAKSVPLMVPRDPEMRPEPMVVVDTTRPFSSVARSAEVRLVTCKLVVVAFTAKVLEAMSRVPLSHIGVVVLCTATPS